VIVIDRWGTQTSLLVNIAAEPLDNELVGRAERTLDLIHRWGYAPTIETLAASLLGGSVSERDLSVALARSRRVTVEADFVSLRGHEQLLRKSRDRVAENGRLNGHARGIAEDFARDLVRHCPFVECVALSGSVASGGYSNGDDIDFDLFVQSGTKYITYLMANVIGLKYAWRYRDLESDELHRMPFLPKVTCVNVVWPADQTRPFLRQDVGLAFELMRCIPLWGAQRFRDVVSDNRWTEEYLPQLGSRRTPDCLDAPRSSFGRILQGADRVRPVLRVLEAASRGLSWVLYHVVQASRRKNPAARERIEFLRRVKFPYEVFQD